MKYERFEDLPVWKAGIELAVKIFDFTGNPKLKGKGDIANQIQRAALSITNNIAEGFERGTTQDLITFIYYARGSAGEVRSVLCVIERMSAFFDFKFEISNLKSEAEAVAKQLRAWAESLQNSEIKGQRYLTDKTKQIYNQDKKVKQFWEEGQKRLEEKLRMREEERLAKLNP